ncbi:hypothetical protein EVAR_12592_1 [Eumeta japonica]|uniref:Uncharacterized protein n=1 Tax=Eumeta variegata TaxID=151549 RepID=A0A4C1UEQ4_EUMVA|nr:hypothetical protein EVAR_12592_1 [Eumeta japonica]
MRHLTRTVVVVTDQIQLTPRLEEHVESSSPDIGGHHVGAGDHDQLGQRESLSNSNRKIMGGDRKIASAESQVIHKNFTEIKKLPLG